MGGNYLLDTNIVIALFAGETFSPSEFAMTDKLFVSSIALGELYFGAYKSGRVTENVRRLEEFASKNVIVGCDSTTSRLFGKIKETLRKKGKPIPDNDIWIAATSLQHSYTLVTRDSHFGEIEDLITERR